MRNAASRLLLVAGALVLAAPAFAARVEFKVGPGPSAMSEEEKAIVADPAKGLEHGVILLEEIDRDETLGTDTHVAYHLRAKILSAEARSLGDLEIPVNTKTGQLEQFWARVILPDGSARVLPRDELRPQTLVASDGENVKVLRGALPGVVPGSVVDYGWVYWEKGVDRWTRVPLQKRWPIRLFRYRWTPLRTMARAVHETRVEGLDVAIDRKETTTTVTARDLAPVAEEPWMPSDDAVRAVLNFYYIDRDVDTKDFWNAAAKKVDREAREWAGEKASRDALAMMSLPAGGDLVSRLKAAYDWIGSNIRNTALRTAEESEAIPDAEKDAEDLRKRTVAEVLAAKEALAWRLDDLYLGVARALGAEANIVLATDRTEHYWDEGMLSLEQFDWRLVAVRAPGEPDEKAILADAGSGLPFGEVPWIVTGARGCLTSAAGFRVLPIFPADYEKNLAETKAEISFGPDGAAARWTRTGTGQQGYFERREVRILGGEERRERLEALCGAGEGFDPAKAEAPTALAGASAGFLLECEGTIGAADPADAPAEYAFKPEGPWNLPVPVFADPARVHPIVWSFPGIEKTTLAVAAPAGFAARGVPPPVRLEERFGRYTMTVRPTPSGFQLERELWFGPMLVKPEDYEKLRLFLQDVVRADRTPLVFRRETAGP